MDRINKVTSFRKGLVYIKPFFFSFFLAVIDSHVIFPAEVFPVLALFSCLFGVLNEGVLF